MLKKQKNYQMKIKIFSRSLPSSPSKIKKEIERDKIQREKENKQHLDYLKSQGFEISLSEFKQILDEKNINYVQFNDVKSFLIPKEGGYGRDLERKDIGTILILKSGMFVPKNGSCSGRSGCSEYKKPVWIGSWSTEVYNLTQYEMKKILQKYSGYGKNLRLRREKWMTTDPVTKKEVRSSVKRYSLDYRSDYVYKEFTDCLDDFRKLAEEKFKKQKKTKTYTFIINNIKFQYTANIIESISGYSEDLSYNYYFYDNQGNYIERIPSYVSYG